MRVHIVGGGLAGCEAALTLARRGVAVALHEMKPARRTPAHQSEHLAELVCSNSLRSAALTNAVGLLKEEMRRLGSAVIAAADAHRVPAGDALAVDREAFARALTEAVLAEPGIEVRREEVTEIPVERPVVIATGPLTSDALAARIREQTGAGQLYFYDSIAPIVAGDSFDWERVFRASRYGKGEGADYVNCPLTEGEYRRFVDEVRRAEKVPPHRFEEPRYFEACLPLEVMAERGDDVLAFGPMKPVGLVDPRTGRRPFAVVQLRQENREGTAYNLVGFQTKLTYPEQDRVFRMVPGLGRAEFLRYGSAHRNTYLDSPKLLDERLMLRSAPGVHFAGQVTGVEGYVESAAVGLYLGLMLAAEARGAALPPPPRTTALGALLSHVRHGSLSGTFSPQNVNWGLVPPLAEPPRRKADEKRRLAERALADLAAWAAAL
jgi:methylenetetrahydrofolate--tRNA-(uracil-5-)-methyltransferase